MHDPVERAAAGRCSKLRRGCRAQQGRRIPIFFDLAYELLLHDPRAEPFVSVLPEDELGIAYEIGTLSKVLAPALRIGYLLGPDGPLMNAMVQKTSDTGFSAPLFVQEMAELPAGPAHRGATARRERRLPRKSGGGAARGSSGAWEPFLAECRGGSAGFYYYLTFRDVETHPSSPFFRFLTRTTAMRRWTARRAEALPRVIYIPGEYCVHPRGELAGRGRRQLRLSYGFEDVPEILRALEWMREAAEYARRTHGLAAGRRAR